MVELKPAADPLRRLARTGEMPAGELHSPPRRAHDDVPPALRRHPGLQPGQESGHVLARQRARLLAAVLARVKVIRQVAEEANVPLGGLRPNPVRILRIADGSWAEFQKRRLVRSGGTVEQYKQPHLVPDLELIGSFRHLEVVTQG